MKNFLTYQNSANFSKLDLRQTIQNVYKFFSQLMDDSKKSFNLLDLDSIPQAFGFDKIPLISQKFIPLMKKNMKISIIIFMEIMAPKIILF